GVGSWAEVSSLLLIASTVPPALVAAFLLIEHDRLDRETVLSLLAASASWYWKVVSELALCIAAVALFVWLTTTAWLAWAEPGAMALWTEPSILEVLGYTTADHNEISFVWVQVAVISVCYGTAIALLKSVLFGPRPPHSWTAAMNRLRAEGTS
ncbi:MAG: hypothetical protein JXJ18_13725, partial [Rhodobacteraceae bacterium]|nr:hypothetical protein [Paracoccaceae bacterium]